MNKILIYGYNSSSPDPVCEVYGDYMYVDTANNNLFIYKNYPEEEVMAVFRSLNWGAAVMVAALSNPTKEGE